MTRLLFLAAVLLIMAASSFGLVRPGEAEAHCFNVTGKHEQFLHSGNTSLHAHQALIQHAPAVITQNPCS